MVGGSRVMTSRASRGQPFFMWLVAVAKNSLRSRHVTRSMVVILSDTATLLALVKPEVSKNRYQAWELEKMKTSDTRGVWKHAPQEFCFCYIKIYAI